MTRVKFSEKLQSTVHSSGLTVPSWSSENLFETMPHNVVSSGCKVFVAGFPLSQHKVPQLSLNCSDLLLPIACGIFQTCHHLVATHLNS
jgi:hypothetical protein